MKKIEILNKMSKIHDEIKKHPYRFNFSTEYVDDYKELLYELSEAWSKMIYQCDDLDDKESIIYKRFGEWIHDYRSILQCWKKNYFPIKYFDYYEQMLQITHNYIDNGIIDTYYGLEKNKEGNYDTIKHVLITPESCGISSSELPNYYAIDKKYNIDDKKMMEYFSNVPYIKNFPDKIQSAYDNWVHNIKPVLIWINDYMIKENDNQSIKEEERL